MDVNEFDFHKDCHLSALYNPAAMMCGPLQIGPLRCVVRLNLSSSHCEVRYLTQNRLPVPETSARRNRESFATEIETHLPPFIEGRVCCGKLNPLPSSLIPIN